MNIQVFTPSAIKKLPKPAKLWAIWEESVSGQHIERTVTIKDDNDPSTWVWPYRQPLLTDDYQENTEMVIPGTLVFLRLEDLAKIHRVIDCDNNTYAFLPAPNMPWGAGPTITLLNGYRLRFNQYRHDIICPPDKELEA